MSADPTDGWDEDRLHLWLSEQDWPRGLIGSRGHDAAVLDASSDRRALCTDQCVAGVHFEEGTPGRDAGAKAVLRTLSDLAAAAARPCAVTLAVRAPSSIAESWIQAAILGAREAAVAHGAELVAGDLSCGPGPASLVVAALGDVALDRAPVGRDRAEVGQAVVLTGAVGGSLVRGRHLAPTPRIDEGVLLARAGATAMMDVSDGLALDLFRIARASGVAIELELDRVPVHPDATAAAAASGRDALDHALHDGEDHELVATLEGAAAEGLGVTVVGRVVRGAGLELVTASGRERWTPERGGWTHGGTRG